MITRTNETFWTEGTERRGSEMRKAEGIVYSARQAPSHKCARTQAWRKRRVVRQERRRTRLVLQNCDSVIMASDEMVG